LEPNICHELLVLYGMLVKFDSQSRTVGDDQSRPDALVLH